MLKILNYWTRTRVQKHELGLLRRHGDFAEVLTPGVHWKRGFGQTVQLINTLNTQFEHPLLDVLVNEQALAERLHVIDLADNQRALVWLDKRLKWVLGPGRHAFWKAPRQVDVEVYDVSVFRFEHEKLDAVLNLPGAQRFLQGVHVESHERVMLYHDGELVQQLEPGVHVYWKDRGRVTWKAVDLREQVTDVAGQEIMTADKVTLRMNLVVTWQVTDAEKSVSVVTDATQALYREAQLALREAVGGRTLDELLGDKQTVGVEVREALAGRAAEFGVAVRGVGLRDLILPGDMKSILNQVIEAEKQAQANLIRRREETAAARSQANTAKLLDQNPALLRMKELEALQEILAGAKTTFVFGSGNITDQVQRLVANDNKD